MVGGAVTDKISANNSMDFNDTSNAVHPLNYLHHEFIRPFPNIKLTLVSTKEVSEIIKSLKWKNSHGYDEIPIKVSLPYIIAPLIYTGCHRRNGPNFGRVFLMLNYTDITQNTYIQS